MDKVKFDSPSVQNYLGILQSVITRMSTNSASCKTWCITLVSAIIVIVADKSKPEYIWISFFPIFLFFLLDSYYLGLEKNFRDLYNSFITKLHRDGVTMSDVYIVSPGKIGDVLLSMIFAMKSIAIWPFYVVLSLMLYIIKTVVLG